MKFQEVDRHGRVSPARPGELPPRLALPAEKQQAQELRGLGHRAVTEGVNLKYVDSMRRAVYEAADTIDALASRATRLEEALQRIADPEAEWTQYKAGLKAGKGAHPLPFEIARSALEGQP